MEHKKLLEENRKLIAAIIKQPEPEVLVSSVIGINTKTIYPIETKIPRDPEKNLPMLSSYSSISPDYDVLRTAEKMKGQIMTQRLIIGDPQLFLEEVISLEKLITKHKKNIITKEKMEKDYTEWCINFFKVQRNNPGILYKGKSFLPSIITYTKEISENNVYYSLLRNNPEYLMPLKPFFPTLKEYKTLDLYKLKLDWMKFLKKYEMIDNYYKTCELLELIQKTS